MKYLRVHDYDMPYIEVGRGTPLVCVHGSLSDFRIWSPTLGPLSRRHRVIAVSLRHFFPEHWDGSGTRYTMAQHVADVVAFIEALGAGPVHLMGHSRGGHIVFRVAQQRPDLLRRLVLAEPGGTLDASLAPANMPPTPLGSPLAAAAAKVAAGDIDGGLEIMIDAINVEGTWRRLDAASKQQRRDNAMTLVGQVNEGRQPFTRADAAAIAVPTLLIGGADTSGSLPIVLRALADNIPEARMVMIPNTTHTMLIQAPAAFAAAVTEFLAAADR
jgi:pimeloyl-ACP methyl ester carboxylesterase